MFLSSFLFQISLLLRPLGSVFGSALLSVLDTKCIEGAPYNMIPHTWEVFHPAPADQDDAMLLQVVPLSADLGDNLKPIR